MKDIDLPPSFPVLALLWTSSEKARTITLYFILAKEYSFLMQALTTGVIEDLLPVFLDINQNHFDGFLEAPKLQWNSRFWSCAGRFLPGRRRFPKSDPPTIEVASYLKTEPNASFLIYDTLAHETIHYWLWVRERPFGHTPEFLSKLRAMGAGRFNRSPCLRILKYFCKVCQKRFESPKKLDSLACADCCQTYSKGKYDSRFKLIRASRLSASESA